MGNAGSLNLSGYGIDTVTIGRQVSIRLKDSSGNNAQIAVFTGNANDAQELKFNSDTKTHQAFMSIVGSDNVLDINDIEGIKNKVKTYCIKVDDKNAKETGAVRLMLPNGSILEIDFWTDKELNNLQENSKSDFEKFYETSKKYLTSNNEVIKGIKENGKRAWNWFAEKVDTAFDRIEQWQRTP